MEFGDVLQWARPVVKAAAAMSAKTPYALARINQADDRYRRRMQEMEDDERRRQEKEALMDAFKFASTPGLDEGKVQEYMNGLSEKYPEVDASKVMGAVISTVNAMDGLQDRRTQRKQRDEAHKMAMTNHANSLEDRTQRILNDKKRMGWDEEDRKNKLADRKYNLSRRGIEDSQNDRLFDANLEYRNAMTAKANRAPAAGAGGSGKVSTADRKFDQSQAYKNVSGFFGANGIPYQEDDAGNLIGSVENEVQLREIRKTAESQGLRVLEKVNKEPGGVMSDGKTTYSFAIVPGAGQSSGGQGGTPGGVPGSGGKKPLGDFDRGASPGGASQTEEEKAAEFRANADAIVKDVESDPRSLEVFLQDPTYKKLYHEYKGGQGKSRSETGKALASDPTLRKKFRELKKQGMSRREAIDALSAESTKPRNAQEALYGRQKAPDSLIDKMQERIGKQQRPEYKKSGEKELEFFLRREGVGKTLGERKRKARALRNQYKGMTDEEIVMALSEASESRVAGAK